MIRYNIWYNVPQCYVAEFITEVYNLPGFIRHNNKTIIKKELSEMLQKYNYVIIKNDTDRNNLHFRTEYNERYMHEEKEPYIPDNELEKWQRWMEPYIPDNELNTDIKEVNMNKYDSLIDIINKYGSNIRVKIKTNTDNEIRQIVNNNKLGALINKANEIVGAIYYYLPSDFDYLTKVEKDNIDNLKNEQNIKLQNLDTTLNTCISLIKACDTFEEAKNILIMYNIIDAKTMQIVEA